MTLAPEAARRLARVLTTALDDPFEINPEHAVPIRSIVWSTYAAQLGKYVRALHDAVVNVTAETGSTFANVRSQIDEVLSSRAAVVTTLLQMSGFEYFEPAFAQETLDVTARWVEELATRLETGESAGRPDADWLEDFVDRWTGDMPSPDGDVVARAFDMPDNPTDEAGFFEPSAVLSHYAYDNFRLLERTFSQLRSLGLPAGPDLLASVCAVGWIASSSDPVLARTTALTYLDAMLAADHSLSDAVEAYHQGREAASRQAHDRVRDAMVDLSGARAGSEGLALGVADLYSRTVEGPVRRYGWSLVCLQVGEWTEPPMLGTLKPRMAAHGGLAGVVAEHMILLEIRNGNQHSDLTWDGFDEVFRSGTSTYSLEQVKRAVGDSLSFDAGCKAARATFASMHVVPDRSLPASDDANRLPASQRVQAVFGANGLRVVRTDLNTTNAQIWVAELNGARVNPCFQALVDTHRLLPRVTQFEVIDIDDETRRIAVSAADLDATYPVREAAINAFEAMPLASFLPANLGARLAHEDPETAARNAAWIALDDMLDAVDGGPVTLDEDAAEVLSARVRIIEIALSACVEHFAGRATNLAPLDAALRDVRGLRDELEASPGPGHVPDRSPSVSRARKRHLNWPTPWRHPTIRPTSPDSIDPHPARQRRDPLERPWFTI